MNKTNKKLRIVIIVTMLVLYLPISGICQPDPGNAPDVPLDGGISLVLIAGGIIGAKKVRDNKKDKENI